MAKGSIPEQPYIARKKGEPGEDSFEGLLSLGIDLVQQLARSVWTDYNEHDPGVTILEQICYALTDIVYRADFPVEDFLVGENGQIDWKKQSLMPPETAFPCRPTTISDYNATLCDELIPGTANVRIELRSGQQPAGLYRIVVLPLPQYTGAIDSIGKSREAFAGRRNLCEDLDDVELLGTTDCNLQARVDIRDGFEPAEILAKIYYQTQKKVTAGIEFKRYDLALNHGKNPEEVFRGPFTRSGVVATDNGAPATVLPDLELFRLIKNLDGVENVTVPHTHSIGARSGMTNPEKADSKPKALRVPPPRLDAKKQIQLFRGGMRIVPNEHDLEMNYRKQHFANRVVPFSPEQVAGLLSRPVGFFRDLSEYSSVQFQFPGTYGLGRRGVPKSAGRERRALAHQLKAYLLFFDQHLADYLAMLANIRRLFSTELTKAGRTYFFQVLDEEAFPGIDDVYPRFPDGTLKRLPGFDDSIERTTRILDYFLALYGESFCDDVLQSSKPETRIAQDISARDDRLAYLRDIESVTRDRAAAADYTKEYSQRGRSGLEAKLSRLLGFEKNYVNQERVGLIEHILLRPRAANGGAYKDVPAEFFAHRITVLFPSWSVGHRDESFRRFAEETVRSACPAHIFAEIRWLTRDEMDTFDKLHATWWKTHLDWQNTGRSAPDAEALDLIGFLRQTSLGKLDTALSKLEWLPRTPATGEKYRLIEHGLLRPASGGVHKDIPESFYSFRISVVFPHCADPDVIIAAEEAVHANCPPHIHPNILWLAPDAMRRFDRLHGYWRKRSEKASSSCRPANAAARVLVGFLHGKDRKRSK